jgi:selenocysteine lyase/cysteine desulfurase
MSLARRQFFTRAAAWLSAGAAAACGGAPRSGREAAHLLGLDRSTALGPRGSGGDVWADVRAQFDLHPDYIHLDALYISSHPRVVREAIDTFRHGLDRMPVLYLARENRERQQAACEAAAHYLGVEADDIALTDSTTTGIGLMYNAMRLRPGDEILTTDEDYFVTHESLRNAAARSGATVRQIPLYDDSAGATIEQIVERIASEIRPATRVLSLTWVHSSTGMKLPVEAIAAEARRRAADPDALYIGLDGVHGFGIEDVRLADLGVDFFAAGCHKWLFGPRGTGVLWARPHAWAFLRPIIPSFLDDEVWSAWMRDEDVSGPTTAIRMTPGGFKAFEHLWALPAAFALHEAIGRDRVEARTHALNRQLKDGLAALPDVRVVTPMSETLSSGLVCVDIDGLSAERAVARLRERRIIATVTPYARRLVRFATSIRNTPEEIGATIEAVAEL